MLGIRSLRSGVVVMTTRTIGHRTFACVSMIPPFLPSKCNTVDGEAGLFRDASVRQPFLFVSNHRCYSTTILLLSEEASKYKYTLEEVAAYREAQKHQKLMAQDYNNRRAAYKRQVSALRKQYAEEYARHKVEDKAAKVTQQEQIMRHRLERQRLKNIKTAKNMMRQEELRKDREKEFQQHLEKQQVIRDATRERFRRARQMVIDKLEEEAPLWLTTVDEVEAAFTREAEQLLWARPGGVIGAPNPSLDSHFWQFECHSQQIRKSYPYMRDILLEEFLEETYDEVNIDPNFWTPERVAEQEYKEYRARLHALVRTSGRTELLRKQRELIADDAAAQDPEIIQTKPPVPSMGMLANNKALEEEGAKLLLKNPTRFFIFDEQQLEHPVPIDHVNANENEYEGPTLGSPLRLRDPVRDGTPDGNPFPRIIGKMDKPDMRTEREKKQEERERKLLEAAETAKREASGGAVAEVDLEAEENAGEDMDYDARGAYDSDDEEWRKGLDPEKDKDLWNMPAHLRYKEEDFAWVKEQVEAKVNFLEEQFLQDINALKNDMVNEKRAMAATPEEEKFSEDSLEAAVTELSDQSLLALSNLDEAYFINPDMPEHELENAMKGIIGLTREQIMEVLHRDRTIPEEELDKL